MSVESSEAGIDIEKKSSSSDRPTDRQDPCLHTIVDVYNSVPRTYSYVHSGVLQIFKAARVYVFPFVSIGQLRA